MLSVVAEHRYLHKAHSARPSIYLGGAVKTEHCGYAGAYLQGKQDGEKGRLYCFSTGKTCGSTGHITHIERPETDLGQAICHSGGKDYKYLQTVCFLGEICTQQNAIRRRATQPGRNAAQSRLAAVCQGNFRQSACYIRVT